MKYNDWMEMGCGPRVRSFLRALQELCAEHNVCITPAVNDGLTVWHWEDVDDEDEKTGTVGFDWVDDLTDLDT